MGSKAGSAVALVIALVLVGFGAVSIVKGLDGRSTSRIR